MQVLSKEAKRLAASREYVSKARQLLRNQRSSDPADSNNDSFTVTIDKETLTVRLVEPK